MPTSRRVPLLASLLLAIASPAARSAQPPATAAPELAALFEALQQPAVTGMVEAPPQLRIGRAEIRPTPGARMLVLSALGRPCGLMLDGPAQLTYHVEDRFSIPLAIRNLKRASGLQAERNGDVMVVKGALKGMAVWGFDLDLPSEPGAAPSGAALPEWLQDVLKSKLGANPARDLLTTA